MELYEEAVDLALKIDHLVLAKRSANLQAAPSARKKLWLRIARRVIQRDAEPGATGTPRAGATTGRPLDEQTASRLRESVLAAATLLSECSLLRIEARACERAGRRGGCPAPPAPAPDPPAGRERQELLVFFPDFVRIDEFKLDVCTSLEEFGRQASAARVHCSEAISLTPIPHLPARDARPTDAEGFDHRRRPQGEDQSVARPGTQCGGQPRVRLP